MVHYNFLRMRFYYNHPVKAKLSSVTLKLFPLVLAGLDGKLGHHWCDTSSLPAGQAGQTPLSSNGFGILLNVAMCSNVSYVLLSPQPADTRGKATKPTFFCLFLVL